MESNKFEIEVLTRLTKIETMLTDFNKVEEKVDYAYNLSKNNKADIDEIKDKNKWLSRTTIAAIIVLVINLIWNLIKISK